jgi:hypothetical protein
MLASYAIVPFTFISYMSLSVSNQERASSLKPTTQPSVPDAGVITLTSTHFSPEE